MRIGGHEMRPIQAIGQVQKKAGLKPAFSRYRLHTSTLTYLIVVSIKDHLCLCGVVSVIVLKLFVTLMQICTVTARHH